MPSAPSRGRRCRVPAEMLAQRLRAEGQPRDPSGRGAAGPGLRSPGEVEERRPPFGCARPPARGLPGDRLPCPPVRGQPQVLPGEVQEGTRNLSYACPNHLGREIHLFEHSLRNDPRFGLLVAKFFLKAKLRV